MKATTLQAKYRHIMRKNFLANSWYYMRNRQVYKWFMYCRMMGPNSAKRLFDRRHKTKFIAKRRNVYRPLV